MDSRSILKAALVVALSSVWIMPRSCAQSEAWAIGSTRVDLAGSQVPFTTVELPHPGGPFGYSGTPATTSQMVRTDGSCHVLFFGIDGRLYNSYGDLIADSYGSGCQQCLQPGVMEMLSVPVPGQCGLYYILTSMPSGLTDAYVQVALLDMNQANPYVPNHNGRLLDLLDDHEYWNLYPQFQTNGWEPGFDPHMDMNLPYSTSEGVLGAPEDAKGNAPMLRIIDPVGNGTLFWLYAIYNTRVIEFKIDGTGIYPMTTAAGPYIPTFYDNSPFGSKSYQRDASVAKTTSGEIRLALTDHGLNAWPAVSGTDPLYPVLVMRFNATTGALIGNVQGLADGVNGLPEFGNTNGSAMTNSLGSPGLTGPAGIAWLAEATRLLISGYEADTDTHLWAARLGVFDLSTNQWFDLVPTLNIQAPLSLADLVQSRMYRNISPVVTGDAIYIPYIGGTAAISGIDDATYALAPAVGFGSGAPAFNNANGLYPPAFLDAQITRDASVAHYNSVACCDLRMSSEARPGLTITTGNTIATPWTPGNNPFGECGDLVFSGDVIIEAGVHLYVENMTWRFAENAHLIVRPSGSVRFNLCELTSYECPGDRWPGAIVEGNSSIHDQFNTHQGWMTLQSSIVSRAVTGVWCGHQSDQDHGGGVLKAYGSSFTDNIRDVRIEHFHRISGGVEQNNYCVMSNCTFWTTPNWPDLGVNVPNEHVRLTDVNGVRMSASHFTNDFFTLFSVMQRGVGISADHATFYCDGYQNYAQNYFRHLTAGIWTSVPNPAFTYRISGMHFDRNFVGAYDLQGANSMITNNQFTMLGNTAGISTATIGLYLFQSQGYTVERNTFLDGNNFSLPNPLASVGIWFRGPAEMNNRIYNNTFTNLFAGNVVEGNHASQTGTFPPSYSGLEMLCGDYSGEVVDQLIAQDGYIKLDQGTNANASSTANNRYYTSADCSARWHPFVITTHPLGAYIRYHWYDDGSQTPELRPSCVEDGLGNHIAPVGQYYDLWPAVVGTDPFDKSIFCTSGDLDVDGSGQSELSNQYNFKLNELHAAAQAYEGLVDHHEKAATLDAINADPPWPSYQLRDLLLARSPLSDTVLLTMITRRETMDQWHLSQVLVANSALSKAVWEAIDNSGLLQPFFYNLVKAHDTDPSFRSLLEQEVSQRSSEKGQLQHRLVLALSEDSTNTSKFEALLSTYKADSAGYGLRAAYQLALANGHYTTLSELGSEMAGDRNARTLIDFGTLQYQLEGRWDRADSTARAWLLNTAFSEVGYGSAAAWGVCYAYGLTDSLPPGVLPSMLRSLVLQGSRGASYAELGLTAYPNPADDRAMFTLPAGVECGTLELFDAQGNLIHSIRVKAKQAFIEVDTHTWRPGLYLARLAVEGIDVAGTKLTIAR